MIVNLIRLFAGPRRTWRTIMDATLLLAALGLGGLAGCGNPYTQQPDFEPRVSEASSDPHVTSPVLLPPSNEEASAPVAAPTPTRLITDAVSPATVDKRKPGPVQVGVNLGGIRDYSSELVFVDAFKASRKWISQEKGKPWGQGGPLDLDEHGEVKSLRPNQYAETVIVTDFEPHLPVGDYLILHEGKGKLRLNGPARIVGGENGRLRVRIDQSKGGIFLAIMETDSSDPLRKIRFIPAEAETTYESQPFRQPFLDRWRDFAVLRFMDWMETNNSKIARWEDRPKPSDARQSLHGVALEYQIALCNTLDVAPWFCMPHRADDEYVRQFALQVKRELKPGKPIWVEYSNECWNNQFEQSRYCRDRGKELKLSDNDFQAQLRFVSQRSVEIFRIWREVFGSEADRVVRVLPAQSANPWTGLQVMDWNDAFKEADAIAIAPYFGNEWGSPKRVEETLKLEVTQLLDALQDSVANSLGKVREYAALARERGLELVAYEAGQHLAGHGGAENNEALTALFHAANRHPRMKTLYETYLDGWADAGGGLIVMFSSMGKPSKWGSWGMLEHEGQSLDEAPKFSAVREFLRRHPSR